MTELDAHDLLPPEPQPEPGRGRWRRWQPLIGLVGLAGLAVAAASSIDDVREQELPGVPALVVALVLHMVALSFAGRAWVALFPPAADRRQLTSGLYTSQLTKYLPAGGILQAASQVAMSGQDGKFGGAALRLPVFSLCLVAAGATLGSGLVFATDLPGWARALAALGLLAPIVLDRRILAAVLRLLRRRVPRLPEPNSLPPQRSIVHAYLYGLGNLSAYGAAFAVLLVNVTDVNPFVTAAALCAAWVVGYLVVPLPSGLGVREAVLIAALPSLTTAALLAASVAHRVLGIVAEAVMAGTAQWRARRRNTPH